ANEMLDLVDKGEADYTIVSISIYSLPDYPNLEAKFILGEIHHSGWAIKRNHSKLRQKILEFFDYTRKIGQLDNYFKQQTGMPFKASEKFLVALHQTYNIGVFPFVFYGSEDGLPQENITSIFQDKDGYIWFGTFSGASKFNGRKMDNISTADGLISNQVMDVKQDSNSTMFFATLNGISSLNDSISTIISGIPFKHVFIDSDNNKWFYGDAGIYIYNSKKEIIDISKITNKKINNVHSIVQIPDESMFFVGTSHGIYTIDTDDFEIQKVTDNNTYYLFIDADNKVWISAKEGIFYTNIFNLKDGVTGERINDKSNIKTAIQKITQTSDGAIWLIGNFSAYQIFSLNLSPIVYDKSIGLSGQKILSFIVDNEENIWFGYYGGVQKLTNRSLRVIYPEKLNYYVNNIVQDNLNHIWFGFNNKLFVLTDSLVDLTKKISGNYSSFVISKNYNNKNIIVASTKGIFEIETTNLQIVKENIFENELLSLKNIFISSKGEIFISSGYNGIVYYFTNLESKPLSIENSSTTLLQDFYEDNGIIIGACNSGLVYFKDSTFKEYIKFPYTISTIEKVKDNIYLGTENGLYELIGKKLEPIIIHNLSNLSITGISASNDPNHIWLGTFNGLNYVNTNTWEAEFTVDALDGLPGNEIAIGGLLKDAKGMLWIGTLHGICTYDIKKKSQIKYAPDCRIEAITLNGKEVSSLPLSLKHNENNFLFELSGLSFKNEQSIVYEYYLRGKKKVFASSSGVPYKAAYQNLPPGKYSFLYRAKGKDSIWSYYKTLDFEILKPIWLTWWFLSIMVLLLISVVFVIVKLRERALKAQNEELERLVKERTYEIFQQKAAIEAKNAELEQQQEEIIVQRDEIAKRRDIAEKQRDILSHQKEEIMDSIFYAKRIQAAILPPKKYVKEILPESFIVYMPRDIVSGDFYWIKKVNDEILRRRNR
ncbi:MAG: two-component regulator propeller domain-containing protein, partial [Bacteroidota bacterium]|nr:two-component regulator propeller domain-containing protein [Bacteroidota bacterium]